MSLSYRQAAILARNRLNLPPQEVPRLITLVDAALEKLANKVADSKDRPLLITDKSSVTASVTSSGADYYADLSTVISTNGVMLERLRQGEIYHTYAAKTFTDNELNASTDRITISSHLFPTGLKVRLTTDDTLPAGLAANTDYYIIRVDASTIQLATSLNNAHSGTAVDLTLLEGAGTHTVTARESEIVQWIADADFAQYSNGLPLSFIECWLVDTKLYLRNVYGGTLAFSVPFVPTLSTLPTRLEDALVDCIVEIALTGDTDETD